MQRGRPKSDDTAEFRLVRTLTNWGNIIDIVADSYLRSIYFTDKERENYFKSLKYMIKILPADCFLLTHEAYIVNMHHALYYWPVGKGFELYMSNCHIAKVSRDHSGAFLRLLRDFQDIKPIGSEYDIPLVK